MDNPDRIDKRLCQQCGECVRFAQQKATDDFVLPRLLREPPSVCPGTGLRVVGKYYELDQLVELLLRDRVYYEVSGGRVTLSGGEPTFHIDYASQLLRKLKEHRIHTAIQTAGYFHYEAFQSKVLPFPSLVLYDIKQVAESFSIDP